MKRSALLAGIGVLAAAAPASAADLLDTTLTTSGAGAASCLERTPAGGAVAARTLTASAAGYLSAKLTAAGGDWDLAVHDAGTGDRVAASAASGAAELAQGFVRAGQKLRVQACRRSGGARTAAVSVALTPVDVRAPKRPIQIIDVHTPTREKVELLTSLGLDLTEHGEDGVRGVVLSTDAEENLLRAAGFTWTVTTPDVAAASKADREADARFAAATRESELPSGRDGYRRLADFEQEMKDLAAAHPTLVEHFTLPLNSLQGREIAGIEITPDIGARDGKPVFLMTGIHHAREWPSAENPFEFAIELIEGYDAGDERITRLLDQARVVVVPVMNPDGFNLSREAPDAGTVYEYKRKNCRVVDGDAESAALCGIVPGYRGLGAGVDPNRNYGGDWGGPGATLEPVQETYRGAAPFSEPEVENMRRLISSQPVTTFITNHTQGSLILRPPGIAAFGLTKDEPMYKALGDAMAESNAYTSQYSWQLYDTSGTAEAWSYYATGGLGFTFEIHKGNFHLAYQEAVVSEYLGETRNGGPDGNRGAYFTALESTVDTARHSVIEGTAPAGSTLTAEKTFTGMTSRVQPNAALLPWGEPIPVPERLTSEMVVPEDGAFEWHVNPSTRPEIYGGRLPAGPTTDDQTFTAATGERREIIVAEGEDNGAMLVRADVTAPGVQDVSLTLFAVDESGEEVRVARSAISNRSFEEIEYVHAVPGKYVLQVDVVRGNAPATVTVDFVPPEPPEAWTVTCTTPAGASKTTQVVVDRGERARVDTLCG